MGAAAYIGRVGGLAVALGVGAAVAAGHGIASAKPDSDAGPATPSSSESPDSAAGNSGTNTTAQSGSSATNSAGSVSTSTSTPGPADPGQVVSSGGTGLRERLADIVDQARADGTPSQPGSTPNSPFSLAPKKKPATKPTRPSAPLTAGADVKLPKRSSNADSAPKPQTPITRTPTVEARTVQANTRPLVAIKPAEIALRPKGFATAPAIAKPLAAAAQSDAPVALAASESAAQPRVTNLLSKALSLFGFGANPTGIPLGTPVALALLALGSRRESEQTFSQLARSTTTTGTPVAAAALAGGGSTTTLATAAVTPDPYPAVKEAPKRVSANTDFISYVTGPPGAYSINNTTSRFNIGGTDVGTMWDNGIQDNPNTTVNEHQVLIAFGDTFGNSYPVRTGFWRMNTLLRSPDNTLNNGMYVPNTAKGDIYSGSSTIAPEGIDPKEIVDRNNIKGLAIGPEVTIIPTAGISAPGPNGASRQYVNFMSVRSWDSPGRWTTNYSGIAYSDDNGQTWTVADSSIRPAAAGRSVKPFVNGNQNFQQGAYVRGVQLDASGKPVYDENGQLQTDGYVYSYGTPSGRAGTAYLSRVAEADVLDQTKYEYWNGSTWVKNDPSAAKPILPATTSGGFFGFFKTTTYPSVSEMSVQYNEYLGKYVMLYGDKNNNIVARTASTPQGPWSAPTTLVTSSQMPGLYAPMIHPWSGTDYVAPADQKYLYWNLSTWNNYEVRLMRTDLTKTTL